ncbi:hypothetical protein [Streptomyces sp. NRRL S-340]|uniref:hypothetical protein n=1 Tax=Streptomyces sp. NRRL S-340 TaxID=1463901 RepID=UPI000563022E|nr:hypothetical protein [Streptomyces sp. NRRL S-340]
MRTRPTRPLRQLPALRGGAVGAVALTALLALAGCSSHGGTQAGPQPARSLSDAQAAAVPDERATPAPAGPSARPQTPSKAAAGPVVPDARLTPATGSFTAEEKKYLHGRVPAHMDPAAVLQVGQEACQRIGRTAAHDKDAAVGALITGEVPNADAAIGQLCPTLKPLLATAATGFPDGTRKDPRPGSYRALTGTGGCTWQALGADGEVLASGPGTGGAKKVTAKVPAGTRAFVTSGCYAWLPA